MDTKMIFILLVGLHVAESSYSKDVETFFQNFEGQGWQTCINTAISRMSKYQGDLKFAIGIINIYTQDCYYDLHNLFYKTLNAEMRSMDPKGNWKTAGDLINRAIDIVGTQSYPVVYRGCSHDPGQLKSGDTYMFYQITSTSTELNAAGSFGCDGTLIILSNVRGADLSPYSPYDEAEILVKSTVIFTVAKDPVTNAKEIDNIKKGLGTSTDFRRIIYLNWLADCDKVRRKRDAGSCDICDKCNAHISDASTNGEKGALLHLVIVAVFVNYAATTVAL